MQSSKHQLCVHVCVRKTLRKHSRCSQVAIFFGGCKWFIQKGLYTLPNCSIKTPPPQKKKNPTKLVLKLLMQYENGCLLSLCFNCKAPHSIKTLGTVNLESKHMKHPVRFVRFSHLMGCNIDRDCLACKSSSVSACYVLYILAAMGLC